MFTKRNLLLKKGADGKIDWVEKSVEENLPYFRGLNEQTNEIDYEKGELKERSPKKEKTRTTKRVYFCKWNEPNDCYEIANKC